MAGRNNKAGAGRTGGGAAGAAKQLSPDQYKAASAKARSRNMRTGNRVMDNAITSAENVVRKVKKGSAPPKAALKTSSTTDRANNFLTGKRGEFFAKKNRDKAGYRAPSSRIY